MLWKLSWHILGDLATLTRTRYETHDDLVKALYKIHKNQGKGKFTKAIRGHNGGEPALFSTIKQLSSILRRKTKKNIRGCNTWYTENFSNIEVEVVRFDPAWKTSQIFLTPTKIVVPWPFHPGTKDGDKLKGQVSDQDVPEGATLGLDFYEDEYLQMDDCLKALDDIAENRPKASQARDAIEEAGKTNSDHHVTINSYVNNVLGLAHRALPLQANLSIVPDTGTYTDQTNIVSDGSKLIINLGLKPVPKRVKLRSFRKYPDGCW